MLEPQKMPDKKDLPLEEKVFERRNRILHQSDIPNSLIKQRHVEARIIFTGLDADLPSGDTEKKIFFATDTNKLYAWNGEAWKSTTLS